jgi:DHA1 family inner membrane transport protein
MTEIGEIPPPSCVEASDTGSFRGLVATMAFGTVVFQSMSLSPILLGALVEAGRLSNASLGSVSTLELLGIAIASGIGPAIRKVRRPRTLLALACLALVVLNSLCIVAPDAIWIAVIRGACGLLEGGLLAAALLTITYSRHPEALYGYFLGITAVPQILCSYVLSTYAIPRFGASAGFVLMALTSLLAAAACRSVGAWNAGADEEQSPDVIRLSMPRLVALFTIFLQNAAIGATFSYLVLFAGQDGVPPDAIGIAMAALQLFAVLGALTVGLIAWRVDQKFALPLGCLVQAAVVFSLLHYPGANAYIIGCALFGMFWNSLVPFGMKLLLALDPSRRLALYNSAACLGGLAAGPFIASNFVTEQDVAPALRWSVATFICSAALFAALNHTRKRRTATPVDQPTEAI